MIGISGTLKVAGAAGFNERIVFYDSLRSTAPLHRQSSNRSSTRRLTFAWDDCVERNRERC